MSHGTGGFEGPAIGAEGRALHPVGMSFEDGGLFAGVGVPQPRPVVVRPGHHALAIGAEGRALHPVGYGL